MLYDVTILKISVVTQNTYDMYHQQDFRPVPRELSARVHPPEEVALSDLVISATQDLATINYAVTI